MPDLPLQSGIGNYYSSAFSGFTKWFFPLQQSLLIPRTALLWEEVLVPPVEEKAHWELSDLSKDNTSRC